MDKISEILSRCEYFEKLAGLVQLPESSVNQISEFVFSLFAKNVIANTQDEQLINYAKQYLGKDNGQHPNAGYRIFHIPLYQLRYFKSSKYDEIVKNIKDKTGFILDDITVNTRTNSWTVKHGGTYDSSTRSMEVILPDVDSIDGFKQIVHWLKEVIAHELTHYIQDSLNRFINEGKKDPDVSGLPPKKYREPEDMFWQVTLPHDKQDTEFYPSLRHNFMLLERIIKSRTIYQDNKIELCKAALGLPNTLYKNILKDLSSNYQISQNDKRKILHFSKFISTNPIDFFKYLKDNALHKWKLAAKLLWKEMEKW